MKKPYTVNEDKKLNITLPLIVLTSFYTIWQMGVLFYSGNALSLNSGTPVPIDGEWTALVIALGYVSTIAVHTLFHKKVVFLGKIIVVISLAANLISLLPLGANVVAAAYYVTAFLCTFLIGTTYSIEIGLYSNESVLRSNLYGALITGVFAALLQNDFYELSFTAFCAISSVLLLLLLFGYFLLPKTVEVPRMKLRDSKQMIMLPKWVFFGLFVLIFASTLLLVFSSAVAETARHGIFLFYVSGAAVSGVWIFLYKKFKISPFKICSASFALSILGFVFAALSMVFPPLVYPAIVLTSGNLLAGNLIGFFANTAFEYRPSNVIIGLLVSMGFAAAMIQIGLLKLFRDRLSLLFTVISVVSMLFIIFYLLLEPVLSYRFKRLAEPREKRETEEKSGLEAQPDAIEKQAPIEPKFSPSLASLSKRDGQIVELILSGYTVPEIAKEMNYSEESIKTYKKNIYTLLDIHSKRELFSLAKNRENA